MKVFILQEYILDLPQQAFYCYFKINKINNKTNKKYNQTRTNRFFFKSPV